MRHLLELVPADNVMFGTDNPFFPPPGTQTLTFTVTLTLTLTQILTLPLTLTLTLILRFLPPPGVPPQDVFAHEWPSTNKVRCPSSDPSPSHNPIPNPDHNSNLTPSPTQGVDHARCAALGDARQDCPGQRAPAAGQVRGVRGKVTPPPLLRPPASQISS